MAILIAYDDSDRWYDHVMPPIVSESNDPGNDSLMRTAGLCGAPAPRLFLDPDTGLVTTGQ
jgi:phospholipase C